MQESGLLSNGTKICLFESNLQWLFKTEAMCFIVFFDGFLILVHLQIHFRETVSCHVPGACRFRNTRSIHFLMAFWLNQWQTYRLSHTARFYLASNAFFLPDSCASPIRMATNHHRQSQRSRLRCPANSSAVHPAPDQQAYCPICHRRSQPCLP